MAWLEGLTAPDLDISFENGKHFAAVQEMSEEFRQEVTYQGAFGNDGPVLRRIRMLGRGWTQGVSFSFGRYRLRDFAGQEIPHLLCITTSVTNM